MILLMVIFLWECIAALYALPPMQPSRMRASQQFQHVQSNVRMKSEIERIQSEHALETRNLKADNQELKIELNALREALFRKDEQLMDETAKNNQ